MASFFGAPAKGAAAVPVAAAPAKSVAAPPTSARPPAAAINAPVVASVVHQSSPAVASADGTKTLIVSGAIPDKGMVYHNHVYVAPTDTAGLFPKGFEATNFVQLNNGPVFIIQTHPDQKASEIGMSAMTRDAAKVQPGAPCRITPWSLSADSVALALRLQVDVFRERKRCEMKEDEVIELVQQRFAGHVLTRDQVFAADFKGTAITLRVQTVEVPDAKSSDSKDEGVTRYGLQGVITGATRIQCSPNPDNRYLIWEKSASNSASMLLKPDFKFADMGIGGLDQEFAAIFRRAFASRLFPPAVITQLGIKHVKGMLLYGPPGTGKTLIARQIGKMLAGREPKIVNGPEILNKYVGASEENIRKLFQDAEEEYKAKGDASGLHIIIFDEIDAICKQRGSDKSGTGVHDTVVNQLLSKIDGVDALNNILVIGMTNRKDMIDSALLRPGRLEVHVEIGLPDEAGRLQILKIHTRRMKESNLLGADVNLEELASRTKNFSGAELEGLVKGATSYALYGNVDVTKGAPTAKPDIKNIKIVMEHFLTALDEYVPAFGVAEDELKTCLRGEILDWGPEYRRVLHTGKMLIKQVSQSVSTPLLSTLIEGPPGSGKTALAAKIALESGFPYVKLITPENFVDSSERGKVLDINKVFEDAYKSPLSLIIIDNIERLLEYVPIGPRFSNTVLQCLMVLLKKIPPADGRRLIVICTTSNMRILEDMDMRGAFNVVMHMPQLKTPADVARVISLMNLGVEAKELDIIANESPLPIGIKELLMVIEMARQDVTTITAARFSQCMEECGFSKRRTFNDVGSVDLE